ncbi:ComEC/Rec2 family competence protein [Candidatus Dojkabacteria bacterium]|nr:ComEC/Rec2 family competence protein [Candidatus Dojkabacteria bacterium]
MFIVRRLLISTALRFKKEFDWYYYHLIVNPLIVIPILIFLLISLGLKLLLGGPYLLYTLFLFLLILPFVIKRDFKRLGYILLVSIIVSGISILVVKGKIDNQIEKAHEVVEDELRVGRYYVEVRNRVKQKSRYQIVWGKLKNGANIYMQVPRYPEVEKGSRCVFQGDPTFVMGDDGFSKYLINSNTYLQVRLFHIDCVRKEGLSIFTLHIIKSHIVRGIERGLDEPNASLLIGIMFGDDRVYTEEFQSAIRATGLSHIVAASGYNILFVQSLTESLFFFLNVRLRKFLSVPIVLLYCFIAGNTASVLRAMLSNVFGILANFAGYPLPPLFNLFLVCITMLIFNPLYLFDIGFQLSFLATFGIVFIVPAIKKMVNITDAILIPLVCSAVVMPVSSINFGSVSTISVITNFLVLSTLEFMMPLGIMYMFLREISVNISIIIAKIISILFVTTGIVVEFGGKLKLAAIDMGYLLPVILLIALLLVSLARMRTDISVVLR